MNYLNSVTACFINWIAKIGKNIIPIPLYRCNLLDATEHELFSKRNEARLDSAIRDLKKVSLF